MWACAALAALITLLIIVVFCLGRDSYGGACGAPKEGFGPLDAMVYRPCFIDPYGSGREKCKGYTSGLMPSIDVEQEGGWLCPGLLGTVPAI
jgi:hypothetical protein